jgi:hypothetical protein
MASRETRVANTVDADQWKGRSMLDATGKRIGTITEVYEDTGTGMLEWAAVRAGVFGRRSVLIPLAGAVGDADRVQARVTRRQANRAPRIEAGQQLNETQQHELFEHYHLPTPGPGLSPARRT